MVNDTLRSSSRSCSLALIAVIVPVALLLAIVSPVTAQDGPTATFGAPCQDGRLRIRDLATADQTVVDGLLQVQQRASAWQEDAQLVELRLACPLLATGLVWEGTFFSTTAQATFSTSTAEIEPSEDAPEDVPFLDIMGVSFIEVYRSLLRAGFTDDLLLAPASSVTVRLSTGISTFGPPSAPRDVVFVHVAVEERGQIRDVWINTVDGTIYRYEIEG